MAVELYVNSNEAFNANVTISTWRDTTDKTLDYLRKM